MREIVTALAAAKAPAYGFLNASSGAEDPSAAEAITIWRRAGLAVGNHGRDHRNLDDLSPTRFRDQVIANQPAVAPANELVLPGPTPSLDRLAAQAGPPASPAPTLHLGKICS